MTGRFGTRPDEGDTSWMAQGHCRALTNRSVMHPEDIAGVVVAKTVCAGCPVTEQCLAYAIRNHERHGVWGGKSERERKRIATDMRKRGELPRNSQPPVPIRHGEPNQYNRCRAASGTACAACRAANAHQTAEWKRGVA